MLPAARGWQAKHIASFTVELLEVSWDGHCGRLAATLHSLEKIPKMAPVHTDGLRPPPAFFKSERALGYRSTPRMSKQGSGVFVILGDRYEIPAGARMRWKTEEPPLEPCALP